MCLGNARLEFDRRENRITMELFSSRHLFKFQKNGLMYYGTKICFIRKFSEFAEYGVNPVGSSSFTLLLIPGNHFLKCGML